MKKSRSIAMYFVMSILCSLTCLSALEPVTVILPEGEFWTGAKIPLSIELRAQGSFSGTATFQFPELPQTTLMSLGNPVVRSESGQEGEVFVQRHNFAVYTQQDGTLTFPEVPVHFSVKQGEKVEAVTANTPGFDLTIKRPPGLPAGKLVVSSATYTVTQTWTPEVDEAELGMVVTRTVTQTSGDVSGMALSPLPRSVPDGVRAYPSEVSVSDKLNRGVLEGKRVETLRYRFETPGAKVLPAVQFQWWNPQTEKLETRLLPGTDVDVKGSRFMQRIKNEPEKWIYLLFFILSLSYLLWRLRRRLHLPFVQHLPPLNPTNRRSQ